MATTVQAPRVAVCQAIPGRGQPCSLTDLAARRRQSSRPSTGTPSRCHVILFSRRRRPLALPSSSDRTLRHATTAVGPLGVVAFYPDLYGPMQHSPAPLHTRAGARRRALRSRSRATFGRGPSAGTPSAPRGRRPRFAKWTTSRPSRSRRCRPPVPEVLLGDAAQPRAGHSNDERHRATRNRVALCASGKRRRSSKGERKEGRRAIR